MSHSKVWCAFLLALFSFAASAQSFRQDTTPIGDSSAISFASGNGTRLLQRSLECVGLYQPDGTFAPCWKRTKASNASSPSIGSPLDRNSARRAQVPGFVNLEPNEVVITNFQPPYHGSARLKPRSAFANFRDKLIVLAYGQQSLLRTPTRVTTDSRGRIIVSDAELQSIHVLNADGSSVFRIAGGPKRRFHVPAGIAVDARDNIYVADSEQGIVLAYDSEGNWLRTFGTFRGERRFERPTGIAIDRAANLLYVVDPPSNELFVFDLSGDFVQRMGGRSQHLASFRYPTEVSVAADGRVVVLDDFGCRVQVFDRVRKQTASFTVRAQAGEPREPHVGLSVDAAGRIYLSNLAPDSVSIYSPTGKRIGEFGHSGVRAEEFLSPTGIWVDSADRIYVAEFENSRIQVFRPTEVAEISSASEQVLGASR